ncbi:hypothetical protein JCM16106_01300 [Hydrogenophilus islandicus]
MKRRGPQGGWRAALLIAGVIAAAAAVAGPPKVTVYPERGSCIDDPQKMRRDHHAMLHQQKNRTVMLGERDAKVNFQQCIACHASAETRSVAAGPNDFCVACHQYAAVKIDCFTCHQPNAPQSTIQSVRSGR